jgi:circadian clock protein KaiC
MLRYQQQFSFFDPAKIPGSVRYLHLGATELKEGLERVLERIIKEVEATDPKLVLVDSFRSVVLRSHRVGEMDLQQMVQRLSLHLTSWEATTFLVGEYEQSEADSSPIFTVADGIIWLSQATSRNSIVRKLQVVKMRGQPQIPGLHTMRISGDGLQVYPRLLNPDQPSGRLPPDQRPLRKTGVTGLDEMLGGGIPAGYSVIVVGPSGSGKTVLTTQFIREGIARGEPGVIAVFASSPCSRSARRTTSPPRPVNLRCNSSSTTASSACSTSARSISRSTRPWPRSPSRCGRWGPSGSPSTRCPDSSWRWRPPSARTSGNRCTGWSGHWSSSA